VFEAMIDMPSPGQALNSENYVAFHDPQGRFTLHGLKPRRTALFVRAWGYGEAQMDGAAISDAPAGRLRIELEPVEPVRGMVVDDAGQPVAGALVFADAMPPGGGNRNADVVAKSGSDGVFEARSLSPTTRVLVAYHVGFAPGQAAFTPQQDFVTIHLVKGGTLTGRITIGGEVPAMASVSVRSSSAGAGPPLYNQNCDTDGRYTLTSVPPGEYRVSGGVFLGGRGMPLESDAVIEAGKTTTVDFNFDATRARVMGRVTYGEEVVVRGMVVLTVTTAGGESTVHGAIDRDGTYRIDDVPAGLAAVRIVQARSASGADVAYETTTEIPMAEELTLDLAAPGE
jgi:hypothetical protein